MAQLQEPRRCCGGGVRGSDKGGGVRGSDKGGVDVDMEMGGGRGRATTAAGEEEETTTTTATAWACRAFAAGVAALGLAGGGVLVWWALAFHPAREQLWMVPVGLVLLGTPLVAWLSLFASGACWRLDKLRDGSHQPPLATAER